jgi:ABC-type glycerol-3-phosphate transport system substrate-binding protein
VVIPISVYFNLNNKQTKMKKVIAIVAIATSLVACGGASTAPATTDSTAVAADTTVKADSTIAPAVDSTKK